jgi:hypothetical protein
VYNALSLQQEWQYMKGRGKKAKYVWNKEQFDKVDVKETDYLFGKF